MFDYISYYPIKPSEFFQPYQLNESTHRDRKKSIFQPSTPPFIDGIFFTFSIFKKLDVVCSDQDEKRDNFTMAVCCINPFQKPRIIPGKGDTFDKLNNRTI